MTQYIDKSALVAEINKRLEGERFKGSAEELNYLLCFINTLEVKEVDNDSFIEKACNAYCNTCGNSRCSSIGCAKLITFKEELHNRL